MNFPCQPLDPCSTTQPHVGQSAKAMMPTVPLYLLTDRCWNPCLLAVPWRPTRQQPHAPLHRWALDLWFQCIMRDLFLMKMTGHHSQLMDRCWAILQLHLIALHSRLQWIIIRPAARALSPAPSALQCGHVPYVQGRWPQGAHFSRTARQRQQLKALCSATGLSRHPPKLFSKPCLGAPSQPLRPQPVPLTV